MECNSFLFANSLSYGQRFLFSLLRVELFEDSLLFCDWVSGGLKLVFLPFDPGGYLVILSRHFY